MPYDSCLFTALYQKACLPFFLVKLTLAEQD